MNRAHGLEVRTVCNFDGRKGADGRLCAHFSCICVSFAVMGPPFEICVDRRSYERGSDREIKHWPYRSVSILGREAIVSLSSKDSTRGAWNPVCACGAMEIATTMKSIVFKARSVSPDLSVAVRVLGHEPRGYQEHGSPSPFNQTNRRTRT